MTEVDVLFASIPVSQFGSAVAWYGKLFGRRADIVPNDDEVMWRFADAAWFYVIRDERRAGNTVVTLCVSDLNRTLEEIGERGISSGPVESVGDSARKAVITDSDGNSINFIEVRESQPRPG